MSAEEHSLDAVLGKAEVQDSVAERVSSLLEHGGGAIAASPAPDIRAASPAPDIRAASPAPDIRTAATSASPIAEADLRGLVSSAAMARFASAIATRLGFPASDPASVASNSLAISVNSALHAVPEVAAHPHVASALAAHVASLVTARIAASPGMARLIGQHVGAVSVASTATRLARHTSLDT